MLEPGSGGFESGLDVGEHLSGLSADVVHADDLSRGVDRVLPADIDRAYRSADDHHVGEGGALGQTVGIEMLDLSLTWIACHVTALLSRSGAAANAERCRLDVSQQRRRHSE